MGLEQQAIQREQSRFNMVEQQIEEILKHKNV